MPKGQKKACIRCEAHEFSLKPRSDYCYHGQHYSVSFCTDIPQKNSKKTAKAKDSKCIDGPLFNSDNNYATPTFILTSEKNYYSQKGQKMKEDHNRKMVDYSDQKSDINIPKPRTKNNFCSVCRQNYEDYLDHVSNPRHKKKISNSKFNSYIIEMTDKFQMENEQQNSQSLFNNTKISIKSSSATTPAREESDDEVEIISNPNKKIKPNESLGNEYAQPMSGFPMKFYDQAMVAQAPFYRPMPVPPPGYPHAMHDPLHNQLTFNYNMNIFMNPPPFFSFFPGSYPMNYYGMNAYNPCFGMMGNQVRARNNQYIVLDGDEK